MAFILSEVFQGFTGALGKIDAFPVTEQTAIMHLATPEDLAQIPGQWSQAG